MDIKTLINAFRQSCGTCWDHSEKILAVAMRVHRYFKRALTIYSVTGSQAVLFVAFTCIVPFDDNVTFFSV